MVLGFLVLAGCSENAMPPWLPFDCRGPLSYLVGAVPILSAWCTSAPNSMPTPYTKLTACSQLLCHTTNCPVLRRGSTPFYPTHTSSPNHRRWNHSIVEQPSPGVPRERVDLFLVLLAALASLGGRLIGTIRIIHLL